MLSSIALRARASHRRPAEHGRDALKPVLKRRRQSAKGDNLQAETRRVRSLKPARRPLNPACPLIRG